MDGYTKYVLRQLFLGMVLVTAGLTCIIWLSQSLRFVEMIVNRGLTAGTFVYMTMLLLPNFLTIILPIALGFVILFIYSKMISDRELVVMRAAGVSQFGLAKPALLMTFLTLFFGYILNLYLLPESYKSFRVLQWEVRNTYSHVLLKEGAFNSLTGDLTAYIRERTPDGQLLGILVHDGREAGNPVTLMAERGALVDTDQGPRVVMYNGNRQAIGENDTLSILYFDRYVLEIPTSQESFAQRFREARERSTSELFDLENAEDVLERDYGKYRVELHKRLVSPLLGVGFAFIALACLLYGPITRRSQSTRVFSATVLIVMLQLVAMALENVVAKNLTLVPIMYTVALTPILLGVVFLTRHPKAPTTSAPPRNPKSLEPA